MQSANASVRRSPWGLRCTGVCAFSLGVATLILFAMNCVAFNLFLYVNIGANDAICGASTGVLHLAFAPHMDMTQDVEPFDSPNGYIYDDYLANIQTDIIILGPIHLFAERRLDALQPFRFDSNWNGDGYRSIELPLLFVAPTLLLLGYVSQRFHIVRNVAGSSESV